jgi:hypothetical protein
MNAGKRRWFVRSPSPSAGDDHPMYKGRPRERAEVRVRQGPGPINPIPCIHPRASALICGSISLLSLCFGVSVVKL